MNVCREAGLLEDISNICKGLGTLGAASDSITNIFTKIRNAVSYSHGGELGDVLISRFESLFILILDLSTREKLSDMILPMAQYIKTWTGSKPFCKTICRMLVQILCTDEHGEREDLRWEPLEYGLKRESGFFEANWAQLTQGKFGQKLAGAINLLVLAGIMPEKHQDGLTDEVFKVLHVHAMRKAQPSIFHHLFTTIDWVVDTVVPAFATKNLALLITDEDQEQIDFMYRKCRHLVELNRSGQMDVAKEKYDVSDESQILVEFINTQIALETLKKAFPNDKAMRREIEQKLILLDKLSTDLQATWHDSGLRIKPLAILFRGGSAVGKSTMAGISQHVVCQVMGFPEGPEYSCSLNGDDQYQSAYKSCHLCVFIDDKGNTKPDKTQGNPLMVLIQFINNMHCQALKPDVESKGVIDIRCKLVIVTTNTDDLHAWFYSCNPASIMRRFDLIVDVELKEDCVGPGGGPHPRFRESSMPDMWDLTCSTVEITRNESDFLADEWNAVPLHLGKVDLIWYIDYLAGMVPSFFAGQQEIVSAACDMHKKPHCKIHPWYIMPCGKCAQIPEDYKPDEFLPIKEAGDLGGEEKDYNYSIDFSNRCSYFRNKETTPLEKTKTDKIVPSKDSPKKRISRLLEVGTESVKSLFGKIKSTVEREPTLAIMFLIASVGLAAVSIHDVMNTKKKLSEGAILSRIEAAAKVPTALTDRDEKWRLIYSNVPSYPEYSTSCTYEQLCSRIDRNLYNVQYFTYDECTGQRVGKGQWCNAFPIGASEWVLVGHVMDLGPCISCDFKMTHAAGIKTFSCIINETNYRPIFKTDLIVAHISQSGDVFDFSKAMLPTFDEDIIKVGTPVAVINNHISQVEGDPSAYRNPSSYALVTKIRSIEKLAPEGIEPYDCITYEGETSPGMCGSVIVTLSRNPVIIAVHAAGFKQTGAKSYGIGALITKDSALETRSSTIVHTCETTPLSGEALGKSFNVSNEVHPRNPVHFLSQDETYNFEAFGQHDVPLSKFSTSINQTPIAEKVMEAFDFDMKFGPPEKKAVRPSRHRHITGVTTKLHPANPRFVTLASSDYLEKIEKSLLQEDCSFREFVHPLSMDVAINGYPGVRGFDCINPKTSMGFPLNKPKYHFLEHGLDEEIALKSYKFQKMEVVDGKKIYSWELIFDPERIDIRKCVDDIFEAFVDGKRINAIMRCNLKDEALTYKKIAANKIRVFAGAPVDLVIVTRMITLPLINAMSNFPTIFESAVGIDATGKDWLFFKDFISQYGGDRCGDGDYSSFDTKIRPEFSLEAFKILRRILQRCGASDAVLKVIDGIATEIVFPIYEIDGLIIKAFGSNPSGHALTVILNGIINCLYMRYAYYQMHQKDLWAEAGPNIKLGDIPLFHEMVALMTFGDDNTFNVHEDEKLFNMISVTRELDTIGVKYTDATKETSAVPFKSVEDLSFLKRTFYKHPVIGATIGSLEWDSIIRSLIIGRKVKKGQVEPRAQICAQNMVAAIHEVYLGHHHRYEAFVEIMNKIAATTEDEEGFHIKDFYNPPTEQDIINRYEKTICMYDTAFEAVNATNVYRESGEIPSLKPPVMTVPFVDELRSMRSWDDPDFARATPARANRMKYLYIMYRKDFRLLDLEHRLKKEILVLHRPREMKFGTFHYTLPPALQEWATASRVQWMQAFPREVVARHIEDMYGRLCVSEIRYRMGQSEYGPFKALFEHDFRLVHNDGTTNFASFQAQLIYEVVERQKRKIRYWKQQMGVQIARQVNQHYCMPIGEAKALGVYHKLQENQYRKIKGLNDDVIDVIKSFLVPVHGVVDLPPWNLVQRPTFVGTAHTITLADEYYLLVQAAFNPHLAMANAIATLDLDQFQ